MANSLLDFVMSLVRDPDAAAHYAADPAQALGGGGRDSQDFDAGIAGAFGGRTQAVVARSGGAVLSSWCEFDFCRGKTFDHTQSWAG